MKLITILFFVAAIAMTSIPLVTASDYLNCHKVDSQIPYAIAKLCNHPHLKVPGGRTRKGAKWGNIRVKIDGSCSKKHRHHIPEQMCRERFFNLCATQGAGFKDAGVVRTDYSCEHWIIERLKGVPRAHGQYQGPGHHLHKYP